MDQGTILKPDIPGINDPDYVTTSASLVHLDPAQKLSGQVRIWISLGDNNQLIE